MWLNEGIDERDSRLWATIVLIGDDEIWLRWDADGELRTANDSCTRLEAAGINSWRRRTLELWAIEHMTISVFRLAALLDRAVRGEWQRS